MEIVNEKGEVLQHDPKGTMGNGRVHVQKGLTSDGSIEGSSVGTGC